MSVTAHQYFDLYRNTATTIKSVCPACRVGGPASAGDALKLAWFSFIAQQHAPADFESTHTYGVTQGVLDAYGHAGTVLDTSPDAIVKSNTYERGPASGDNAITIRLAPSSAALSRINDGEKCFIHSSFSQLSC